MDGGDHRGRELIGVSFSIANLAMGRTGRWDRRKPGIPIADRIRIRNGQHLQTLRLKDEIRVLRKLVGKRTVRRVQKELREGRNRKRQTRWCRQN